MTTQRTPRRARTALAAAAVIAGGLFAAVTGSAQAAPLAPAAAETVAGDVGATAVHWRGRGHHFGHRHHRHFGFGGRRHFGHRHHYRGFGGGFGHRHHYRGFGGGFGHRHHGFGHRHHW